MTKIDKIEQVLMAGHTVTPLIAIQIAGAMRLAALIYDLKKRGHTIETIMKTDTQGHEYAEYRMVRTRNENAELSALVGYQAA